MNSTEFPPKFNASLRQTASGLVNECRESIALQVSAVVAAGLKVRDHGCFVDAVDRTAHVLPIALLRRAVGSRNGDSWLHGSDDPEVITAIIVLHGSIWGIRVAFGVPQHSRAGVL